VISIYLGCPALALSSITLDSLPEGGEEHNSILPHREREVTEGFDKRGKMNHTLTALTDTPFQTNKHISKI